MLLNQVAHYNALSEKLREELTKKIEGFGSRVRYRFDVEKQNPDPTKYDGDVIFPGKYTLDPCVFDIVDPYDKKSKKIAIVDSVDEKGLPNRFRKVSVKATQRGILDLDLSAGSDDIYVCMYIEMHPKLKDGMFAKKDTVPVMRRIDEVAEAKKEQESRKQRRLALNAAGEMTEKDVIKFADAMQWDSTQDPEVLRNKIEDLAEKDPVFFNDIVSGKAVEYRSVVKQALDRKVIDFDPAEYKFKWSGNQQTITVLSPVGTQTHIEKLAEWFQVGGVKAEEAYKKVKELLPK